MATDQALGVRARLDIDQPTVSAKVLFLVMWPDRVGGTEHAVLTQAAALARRPGVRVRLLGVRHDRDEPWFPVGPHVSLDYLVDARGAVPVGIGAGAPPDETAAALSTQPSLLVDSEWEPAFCRLDDVMLERALGSTDADVVVTTTPSLLAAAAQVLPPDVALVAQEHRTSQMRGASLEPLLRFAARADALVLLTERDRQWLATRLGDPPRLEVIGGALAPGPRPRSALESKLIVTAGRLVPHKQLDHLVRAFAALTDDHPDWQVRVYGEGPDRGRIEELARSLGVGDRVELPGCAKVMADEWAQASVAVLSSRSEGFGLVLLEAFAAGVPVVSYDVPHGPSEVVTQGVDGLLVPSGDVDALSAALRSLVTDDERRRRYGAAALDAVRRFSLDSVTDRWQQLLVDLHATRLTRDTTMKDRL